MHACTGRVAEVTATMQAVPQVVITKSAALSAQRGHPWVWQRAVLRGLGGVAAGDVVQVVGEDGAAAFAGIADPSSPIAVRLWTRGRSPVDRALLARRIAAALRVRDLLFPADAARPTTAYRLLHGEGDLCPGFVVDRYGSTAVLRVDGEGAGAFAERFAGELWPALEARGVTSLAMKATGGERGLSPLRGDVPKDTVHVTEHGVPFVVDLARGQKTGAFLDQRENRRRVGELARGRRVLNLFSYAGGFSLRAALGGASHVTSVDVAAQAHATAQASFRLAGVDPARHAFVSADAFAFLDAAKKRGERWDLVVSDPPSFAPSEKAKARAITAYRALHRACAEVLAEGGIFCAASCSSHVDAETFATTLDAGSLGEGAPELRLLEVRGAPADHPTLPAWPEGRYLKFFVLA